MNNYIKYYYNIDIDKVFFVSNYYYFNYNDSLHYLLPFNESNEIKNELVKITNYLNKFENNYWSIVLNCENKIYTTFENKEYILINTKKLETEQRVDYSDIAFYMYDDIKISWIDLWIERIDYVEKQKHHKFIKNDNIDFYIDYYIGLTENAISYINDTLNNKSPSLNDKKIICNRRIKFNSVYYNYLNPANLIGDHITRNIAELVKEKYINDLYDEKEFLTYIESINLSFYGINMLFGRLLYPSFFFDQYDLLITGKITEKDFVSFCYKNRFYKDVLKSVQNFLNNKYFIKKIHWL